MLQMLHHHPSPLETLHHRIKLLKACLPDVCGYEILQETDVGPPEGHHRPPARPPAVCLRGKQVSG